MPTKTLTAEEKLALLEAQEPSTNGTEEKPKRVGNPLLKAITQEDVDNCSEFLMQKLDQLFKPVDIDTEKFARVHDAYHQWMQDSEAREKAKAMAEIKARMAELGIEITDLKG